MGMFDRFYEADGTEWQTKAYENQLAAYRAGDTVPPLEEHSDVTDYQVEILGSLDVVVNGVLERVYVDSFATVIGNKVSTINDPRNMDLPRINYGGNLYHPEAEQELEARAEQ